MGINKDKWGGGEENNNSTTAAATNKTSNNPLLETLWDQSSSDVRKDGDPMSATMSGQPPDIRPITTTSVVRAGDLLTENRNEVHYWGVESWIFFTLKTPPILPLLP